MKQKSNFSPELQAEIKKDIQACEETILMPKETQSVFYSMKAKYEQLYPNICYNICFARTSQSDYVLHLKMLKSALEGILLNKTEPQSNNQGEGIYIGKLKNNGIIGNANQMTKSTELRSDVNLSALPKARILKK